MGYPGQSRGSVELRPWRVIGKLEPSEACVLPSLICEIKAFERWGLTDQQMRRRFEGVLYDDIPTLREMASVLPQGRVEILTDLFASRDRLGCVFRLNPTTDSVSNRPPIPAETGH